MSCELEGLGLRRGSAAMFILYTLPVLTLSYTLLPSLALGLIMSRSSQNAVVSTSLFLLFSTAGFIFFNHLHRHYYGLGVLELAGIMLKGVRSSLSRLHLEGSRLVQEGPSGKKEVELKGGKLLWLWTVSPVLLFLERGTRKNEGIVLLKAGFKRSEFESFLSCIAGELGMPEDRIKLEYFRDFILSGFRYRKEIELP